MSKGKFSIFAISASLILTGCVPIRTIERPALAGQTEAEQLSMLTTELGNAKSATYAAEDIAKKGRAAIPFLLAALTNQQPLVRSMSAFALGLNQDTGPETMPPLLLALDDPEPSVRANAIFALGEKPQLTSLEVLIVAMKDTNGWVLKNAIFALGASKDKRATLVVVPFLTNDLGSVRFFAAMSLGRLGDTAAVSALIQTLKDRYPHIRARAAISLGEVMDPGAGSALLEAMSDTNATVQTAAIVALAMLKETRALQGLVDILKKPGPAGVTGVKGRLDEEDDRNLRRAAVWALGELRDPRAVPYLLELTPQYSRWLDPYTGFSVRRLPFSYGVRSPVSGKDGFEREASSTGIAVIRSHEMDSDAGKIEKLAPDSRLGPGWALAKIGASAVDPLLAALKDKREIVRVYAVFALGRIQDNRVAEGLISATKDKSKIVRHEAAEALAECGDSRCGSYLIERLEQGDLETLARAYRFFVALGKAGSEDRLVKALDRHGFGDMASAFVNSGNPKLDKAGRAWAQNYGFIVRVEAGKATTLKWGSKPL